MAGKRFDPARAHRLDSAERRTWLPPDEVVRRLELRAGEVVADIGAGTGYFSVPIAGALGAGGRVYAVDAQQEMLDLLRAKLAQTSTQNVEPVLAEGAQTRLADSCCDLAFYANVWHEFPDRAAVLREAQRILKANGRIAILDWRPDVVPEHGPPLEHRLTASGAHDELISAGFADVTTGEVGTYSWLVQARITANR